MKKVAIMTWFNYSNFGTSLQVSALTRAIVKLGYQTEVIQYIPHGKIVTRLDYKDPKTYIKKIENRINKLNAIGVIDNNRESAFQNFLDRHIKLTSLYKTESELYALNNQFDAFVCGSDQIWAPSCFDPKYFLDFVQESRKMISYAPSIGLPEIADPYVRNRMKECIGRFKHLSVREEQGKELIKELCGKEATVVLDPTLLLNLDEWDNMVSNQVEPSPYILCYFLGNNKQSWDHVSKLSKKVGIPVKIIPVFAHDLESGFQVASAIGPKEFLGLIKNAAFVCTDSFHGTVFSILYERPFYTYERFSNKDSNSQNSRIYNILKIVGLEERLIKDKANVMIKPLECKFVDAKQRLEKERKKSLQYLEEALKKSTESLASTNQYMITNTCCGCGACAAVCKQMAIEIKRDEDGFLKAVVDHEKCVGCGICQKVCPYNGLRSTEIDKNNHKLFMVRSKQPKVLQVSSSGGAGYEMSKLLCEQGLVVIGCTYDKEKAEAVHQCVEAGEIDKLHIFQGSKYIQSNSAEAINEIINSSRKAVVFGTPCQISGFDRLLKLKGKQNNYILVDLICHGVPSQNLWKKYIKKGAEKYSYGLNPEVVFRHKQKGWRYMYIYIYNPKSGKFYTCLDKKDLFYRFFLSGNCYSPACYECNYRTASAADIRMGDYWGPRYKKDKNGVSMIIAMTNKGEQVLQQLKDKNKIELERMDCEEYWTVQYPENPIRPVFYEELINGLKDESVELKTLADYYCREYEFRQKLYKYYSIFPKIYRKIGGI